MAKPKQSPVDFVAELMKSAKELDKRQPIQKTRWYVTEVTPVYKENSERVSPYFDSTEQADAWIEKHDPDEGKSFETVKQNQRKMTMLAWVNY